MNHPYPWQVFLGHALITLFCMMGAVNNQDQDGNSFFVLLICAAVHWAITVSSFEKHYD